MASEAEIDLEALRRGDNTAWDRFVARYAPVIHATAARTLIGRGAYDTADVAQDVFMRLAKDDFRLLKAYDPARAAFATWLTVIARNISIDVLRRRRFEPAPLEGRALDVPDPTPPPTRGLALPAGVLTARQRLVLHLLFDKDLDASEVAEQLGVAAQTVRSTKHKAIERLREHFAEEERRERDGDAGGSGRVYPSEDRP